MSLLWDYLFLESRATIASSMAGSESVFASKETGVSSIPSELSAVEEDRIMKVCLKHRTLIINYCKFWGYRSTMHFIV